MYRRPKAKALTFLLFALLLAAVAVTSYAVKEPGDPGSGKWVASEVDDCEGNLICVEWEYTVYGVPTSDEACCVDPALVGTTNYQACDSYFRHDPH